MNQQARALLSGNEAVAAAAKHAGVHFGIGYPGTPSTEILENFSEIGGHAQWAPNEKVALEVGLGAAFAKARALVTMKHVGLNVAADPLFTAAYTGTPGGLVIVVADDPGMASSQNEQDSRHYARAAGLPMLEPADSQEAYDFTARALEISERWQIPAILRMTTRICHSKTVVVYRQLPHSTAEIGYDRDIRQRVMIPAFARDAHRRLRQKLHEIAVWSETCDLNRVTAGSEEPGIITAGVSFAHAQEAVPGAPIFKLGLTYPLPFSALREFAAGKQRCLVVEEGDPVLADDLRAAGISVDAKDESFRFGELTVNRVRAIANGSQDEPLPAGKGKPPQLCPGCPHRVTFEMLRDLDCIITGDIGCYTLGVLAPFNAMDTCVCMGAAIGVGLGLRHVLPEDQARRVVSVIGDSTFAHSGLTGIEEMVYNPPPTGHVVVILDNATTAMTGMQEHPGTGRKLDREPTNQVVFEDVARAMGVTRVFVVDPFKERDALQALLTESLASNDLTLIIVRQPCLLAARKIRQETPRQPATGPA
jgi:indolepyruvate ferredoxin oxidoreductase alpha subunit